jgi:hypothetical protein
MDYQFLKCTKPQKEEKLFWVVVVGRLKVQNALVPVVGINGE